MLNFLKRNVDNFILIVLCIPGFVWCANSGSYNESLIKAENAGYASMCIFFSILLGLIMVFAAFGFKAKRGLINFIILAIVIVINIAPIVGMIHFIMDDNVNKIWAYGKRETVIQFIVFECVALIGLVAAFFRIDYTKRDKD